MKCSSCGEEIPDNAQFCPMCGREVTSSSSDDLSRVDETQQNESSQQSASQPRQFSENDTQRPTVSSGYQKGCVSAAWSDYRQSKGWVGKTLLLSLINCIPILNFFADGFVLNWSREVPYGGHTPLPKRIFTGSNFKIGFFFFVISLVFAIVVGIVGAIVSYVPYIGTLIAFVFVVVEMMFLGLAGLRLAMSGSIGEGFSLGKLWDALKRRWTDLFCSIFPLFIAEMIIDVIAYLLILFYGVALLLLVIDIGVYPDDAASWDLSTLPVYILLFLVIYYVCNVVITATTVLSFRAVGHYVGRYANGWTHEIPRTQDYDTHSSG